MPAASIAAIAVVSLSSIALSLALGVLLVAALPTDFFVREQRPSGHLLRRVLKNVGGGLLILCGLVLSLPVLPGPGIALLLIGLATVDFPAKHRLQRALVRRPAVARSLNRLRALARKPAFRLPD